MPVRLLLVGCCIFFCCGCAQEKQTLRFWHFWSEPNQKRALTKLVQEFEQRHPGIHVELVDLNWADGLSKIQLAFNSNTQPDVLHLGLEWLPQFWGSLKRLPKHSTIGVLPSLLPHCQQNSECIAAPWTVTLRTLYVKSGTPPIPSVPPLEPHNIAKRTIPALWSLGSPVFTRIPYSATIDSLFVQALNQLLRQWKGAYRGSSRELDEKFARGEIQPWITGSWIIPKLQASNNNERFSIDTGFVSLISADVLCLPASKDGNKRGQELIAFLTGTQQSAQFCWENPDAGIPASAQSIARYQNYRLQPLQRQLCRAAAGGQTVAAHRKYLTAEQIFEFVIEKTIVENISGEDAATLLRARLRSVGL
jgi:hypothetical protein